MKETFLTRKDKEVGDGVFDSIAWAFEVHVKQSDNPDARFAILYGNEDSPEKIEFFNVNDWAAEPIFVWRGN